MWKLYSVLFLISSVNGNLEDFAMPNYGSALTRAVANIIFNYHMNQSTTINFIYAADNATHNNKAAEALEDPINEILYLLGNKIVVQLEEYSQMKLSSGKKTNNILFCDNYGSFHKFMQKMNPETFEYQGTYLIIISKDNDSIYETMTKIFEDLWSRYIVNANILWMPNYNEALMYTYYPYTDFYCGRAVPIQLNAYSFDKWLLDTAIFPNKMNDLHGCTLRVVTFPNPPFMIIHELEHEQVEIDGIDGILLRVLAQKMNFNVELFLEMESLWGDVFMNGTSLGAIKMVMNQEVNLTLGECR